MAGYIGEVREGEYWTRCPFCGDTTRHQTKCHFSIHLKTGLYNCHRCSAGGRFSSEEVYALTGQYPRLITQTPTKLTEVERKEVDLVLLEQMLLPGPGAARSTRLERFHITTMIGGNRQTLDVFKLRDVKGALVGFNVRGKDYHRTIGHRGLAYVGPYLQSFSIRIVEGPYDVVTDQDVATVGLPTRAQLKQLKSYSLILCPDGDVLANNMLALRYFSSFGRLSVRGKGPLISQLELLPDGLDPDEVLPNERRTISLSRGRLLSLVRDLNRDSINISKWAQEAV